MSDENEPRRQIGIKKLELPHEGVENEWGLVDPSQFTKKQLKQNQAAINKHRKDPYEYNRPPDPKPLTKTALVYSVNNQDEWTVIGTWVAWKDALATAHELAELPTSYAVKCYGVVDWKGEIQSNKLPKIEELPNFKLDTAGFGNQQLKLSTLMVNIKKRK